MARLPVTNGTILDPKCDILFEPDGVLGAGEAMRRREFIAFVGCTAAAWPLPARAEQSAVPVIGFLNSASPQPFANYVAGFRAGLKETGYVDGQNVVIEFRWAEGHYERLSEMAADLVPPQGGGAGRYWGLTKHCGRQGRHFNAPMVVGEVGLNAAIAFAQTNPIKNQVSAPFPNFR